MKLNKKGFTLIELLAVIVILAIIALIATPAIMNVINNSQIEANERTLETYAAQLELGYANALLDSSKTDDEARQAAAIEYANGQTNGKDITVAASNITWDSTVTGKVSKISIQIDSKDYCYVAGTGASQTACAS